MADPQPEVEAMTEEDEGIQAETSADTQPSIPVFSPVAEVSSPRFESPKAQVVPFFEVCEYQVLISICSFIHIIVEVY